MGGVKDGLLSRVPIVLPLVGVMRCKTMCVVLQRVMAFSSLPRQSLFAFGTR